MIVQHAVVPRVSIAQAFDGWARIRKGLMENPRKRQLQINELMSIN